ncbi:MAG: transporter substrate-binding domain-containing protein [Deltaproteobacteria bacterium]|nr:transporter substrate-binding domain-containing protein [Deltaproteobacteria bacterium]
MKKIYLIIMVGVFVLSLTTGVFAQGTLEKISKSGEFVVGVRDGAIPFAFISKDNENVGFSVDMAREFHKGLEKQLGKPLKLTWKTTNPKTRIPLVANGTIDIECGSTTHTVDREETVDFTITVFITGTQLLVKKGSGIKNDKDLPGKKVGAAQGSTNEKAIRDLNEKGVIKPPANIVVYQEHSQGFLALQRGILDAYCTDGILLAGLKAKAPKPEEFEVVGDLITYDPYAYIVRENDSNFRDFINIQIINMIKDGRFLKNYEKWFGPKGTVPYPMSEEFKILLKLQAWP